MQKQKSYKVDVELFLNITIMKTEENKKQEKLNDEQLDNVAGGFRFGTYDDPYLSTPE